MIEADWEESFARLLAYVEREGGARVPVGTSRMDLRFVLSVERAAQCGRPGAS